jgi:transmembrane sensor
MQTPHNGSGITADSWTEGDDAYRAAESSQSTESVPLSRHHVLWICVSALAMAAALGLWSMAAYQRYSTRIGELGHVELSDGSMAILNTATEIELAFTRNVRRVKLLQGEVLFDVAPDPHRVFVAEVGGFRVETPAGRAALKRSDAAPVGWLVDYARDVAIPLTRRTSRRLFATRGTTFTLRRKSGGTVELVVLEGAAEIRHRRPSALSPASISEGTAVQVVGEELREITSLNAWRLEPKVAWLDRRAVFNTNQTVLGAAQEFNRYNEIKLRFEGSIGDRQIRGEFAVDRPQDFAAIVEKLADAQVSLSGNLITIRDPDDQTKERP